MLRPLTHSIRTACAALVAALVMAGAVPAASHAQGERALSFSGTLDIRDDDWPDGDDIGWGWFDGTAYVSDARPRASVLATACVDEVRAEALVTFRKGVAGGMQGVFVTARVRLFEGDDCNTGDLDGEASRTLFVANGRTVKFDNFHVYNGNESSGDTVDLIMTVTNH